MKSVSNNKQEQIDAILNNDDQRFGSHTIFVHRDFECGICLKRFKKVFTYPDLSVDMCGTCSVAWQRLNKAVELADKSLVDILFKD